MNQCPFHPPCMKPEYALLFIVTAKSQPRSEVRNVERPIFSEVGAPPPQVRKCDKNVSFCPAEVYLRIRLSKASIKQRNSAGTAVPFAVPHTVPPGGPVCLPNEATNTITALQSNSTKLLNTLSNTYKPKIYSDLCRTKPSAIRSHPRFHAVGISSVPLLHGRKTA